MSITEITSFEIFKEAIGKDADFDEWGYDAAIAVVMFYKKNHSACHELGLVYQDIADKYTHAEVRDLKFLKVDVDTQREVDAKRPRHEGDLPIFVMNQNERAVDLVAAWQINDLSVSL
ncbi:uncharacterized protein JCM6883_003721 [Sporobolomyces salmoneus]|uniref:uncharacterized protein n=1 Tax=Sporobolomyces salmoneus TaxID=183962 RepID=UPI003174C595